MYPVHCRRAVIHKGAKLMWLIPVVRISQLFVLVRRASIWLWTDCSSGLSPFLVQADWFGMQGAPKCAAP